ncbi:MAG: PilZ domain-containing protein [Thermoanaerobaculia bacterium]
MILADVMENPDPSRDSTAERQPESPRVILRFEKFSSFVAEYASYLSLGGMFLATPDVQPVGQTVGFAIELTDGFRLVEGVGEVVWMRPRDGGPGNPAGMGLRFRALDENGRQLILKILEEQVRSGGAPFEVDELPADAISTPGAVPESPPQKEVGDDRPPRPLEFDAPWGKELPTLPEEILEDTGSLSEPSPSPAADESFRLAAEAALELESLPELSAPAPPELDDDDLALDPDDPPVEDPPVFEQLAGDAAAAVANPRVEDSAARSAAALDAASAGVSETRLTETRPQAAESVEIHGAILDYEEELAGTSDPSRGIGRDRVASKPRAWIAGLTVVPIAVALSWWLWGRSTPARTAPNPAVDVAAVSEAGDDAAEEPVPRAPPSTPAAEPKPVSEQAFPLPARSSRLAASTVRDISWQSDARGTWVSITLDGETDPGRVRHDRLDWTAEKEQISLLGIELPYLPATVAVGTSELVRIRTALHAAGGPSELRLVFDLTSSATGLEAPQVSGNRLRVLVRRGSS